MKTVPAHRKFLLPLVSSAALALVFLKTISIVPAIPTANRPTSSGIFSDKAAKKPITDQTSGTIRTYPGTMGFAQSKIPT